VRATLSKYHRLMTNTQHVVDGRTLEPVRALIRDRFARSSSDAPCRRMDPRLRTRRRCARVVEEALRLLSRAEVAAREDESLHPVSPDRGDLGTVVPNPPIHRENCPIFATAQLEPFDVGDLLIALAEALEMRPHEPTRTS
jgi:hypothetical protein